MTTIYPEDIEHIKEKEKTLQIIDLRSSSNYKKSHIKDAISIPRDAFIINIKKLIKEGTILFYCNEGIESDNIALYIEKKYKKCKTLSLFGGYKNYLEAM